MIRRKRLPSISLRKSAKKEIRYFSDYQLRWESLIPQLKNYELKSVDFLSIPGDAPKDFIEDSEHRPGHRFRKDRAERYIAKVGAKYYPNESITEQLITRIGQVFRTNIADSKLRIVDGQVRFMSKYFMNQHTEQLTHGAQIFEQCLGKEAYAELAETKTESEFFNFQLVCNAIRNVFPEFENHIVKGLVEMLAFDCLIGHNDRHPYNWAVIVPVLKAQKLRFSPIYDTARALFWNIPEVRVHKMLNDKTQLESYISRCAPPFSWDGEPDVDFFRLMGLIWKHFDEYRPQIDKLLNANALNEALQMAEEEFAPLMSNERKQLIQDCLRIRYHRLLEAVNS